MIGNDLRKSILDYALKGNLSVSMPSEKVEIDSSFKGTAPFVIPDNWKWVKIKDFCSLIRGSGIKKNEVSNEGIQCIRYGEIYTHYSFSFVNAISKVPQSVAKNCKRVQKNDLILTLTGENEYDIAKATAYLGNEELVAGGDLAILTNHNQDPLFLSYMFASPYLISCKSSTAKGNIIVHTSTDKIGEFIVPLPPVNEQKRIVNIIHDLFEKISELEPIEQELFSLRANISLDLEKSILKAAFSGKLSSNPQMLKWKNFYFDDVVDILNGYSFRSNLYQKEGIRIIRITNVQKNKLIDPNPVYYEPNLVENKFMLKENDILISLTGNVGRVAKVTSDFMPCALNQRVGCLRLKNDNIDFDYFYYFLNSPIFENDCVLSSKGLAQKNMSTEWLKRYSIPVPPIEEQKLIINKLNELIPLCSDIENLVNIKF